MPKLGGKVVTLRSLRGVQKGDVLLVVAEGCCRAELNDLAERVGTATQNLDGVESIITNFHYDVKTMDRNALEGMAREIQRVLDRLDGVPQKSRARQRTRAELLFRRH